MKSVLLIAAFNAILFTVLLFQKKPRANHDNVLIFWLLYLAGYIGLYAFYSHELFVHLRLLSVSMVSLLMLHGPFLFLYIQSLVSAKSHFILKDLLHLIPFALFNIYILISFFNPLTAARLSLENISPGDHPPLIFSFFLILTAFSGTLYFLFTLRLFRKHDLNISNNFSNSATLDLLWIRRLVLIFGIVWTALISITIIHHVFNMFTMVFCTDGLFLSLSVFVILIGYFGLKQKVIFTADSIMSGFEKTRVRYSGSRLTDEDSKQYAGKLLDYMKSSKPYLDPELSLPALSKELEISGHYLSQIINEQFKLNFFDFINKYRVDAFMEKVADPAFGKLSLLGIAFECGFNSKSAFNRIFKETTGLTPSQYKKGILDSSSEVPSYKSVRVN